MSRVRATRVASSSTPFGTKSFLWDFKCSFSVISRIWLDEIFLLLLFGFSCSLFSVPQSTIFDKIFTDLDGVDFFNVGIDRFGWIFVVFVADAVTAEFSRKFVSSSEHWLSVRASLVRVSFFISSSFFKLPVVLGILWGTFCGTFLVLLSFGRGEKLRREAKASWESSGTFFDLNADVSLGTFLWEYSGGTLFGEHSLGSIGQLCSLNSCIVAGLAEERTGSTGSTEISGDYSYHRWRLW